MRLGVAGAGRWGGNIIRTASELGVLAGVCDGDTRALDAARSRFDGVHFFSEYEEMLASGMIDAVAIAAPAALHASLATRAIQAGLNVFVEKPLALSVPEASAVVAAARARGVLLVVGHLLLYHPAVCEMLAAIRRGEIGDVRHFRSRRLGWGTLRAHEDVWWSFAPHDVSVMLEVMGDEPIDGKRNASAFVRPHIADITYADFRFSEGRSAHIEVAWIDPARSARIDVFGSQGTLTLTDREGAATLTLTPCGDRLDLRGEPELWRLELRELAFGAEQALARELQAFCDAARGGPTPPSYGEEGLAVVRTLAMAHNGVAMEAVR